MRGIILVFTTVLMFGCAAPAIYTWQDSREPSRDDATADLEECRNYAARQYRPGIPAGAPYLKDQPIATDEMIEYSQGEWRPDRSPFPTTNINSQPVHEVTVDYTGYPGELDYSPGYLDAILEKCMLDRGWEYRARKEGNR